jgi:uncharacterized membrane protein
MLSWLVFVALGKLMIFLGQSFPLPHFLEKYSVVKEWHSCDLCFGTWIYTGLAFFMKMNLFDWYFPLVTELLVGGLISFIVHVFSIGWRDKFSPEIVI